MSESALEINKADAQTIHQESRGNNSPNIIGGGNIVTGRGYEIKTPNGNVIHVPEGGKPNINTNPEGSIYQESHTDDSPNIVDAPKDFFKKGWPFN